MVKRGEVNGLKGWVWVLWRKWWWWYGKRGGRAERRKKRSVACSERREALRRMLRGKEKSISRAAA